MLLKVCRSFIDRLFSQKNAERCALQWWYQRRVNQSYRTAELILDDILQDLFAARRFLETACDQTNTASQQTLNRLESLHHGLEQVSYALSPPYIQYSTPLAFQEVLKHWRSRHPQVNLCTEIVADSALTTATDLVEANMAKPSVTDQVGLMTLEEWLTLIPQYIDETITVSVKLETLQDKTVITTHVGGLTVNQGKTIANLRDMVYLRQAFQLLTGGHSSQTRDKQGMRWQFSWSVPSKTHSFENKEHIGG